MPWYQSLLLGALQGLTEFWPVSSSAHLSLAGWATGWGEPRLAFTVAMHAGTFLAVLVCFRSTVMRLLRVLPGTAGWRKAGDDADRRMLGLLAVALLPALLLGAFAADSSGMMEGMPLLIALSLLAFSPVMAAADRMRPRRGLSSLGWRDALVIGIFQVMAMVPGVSRSGATISAGLFLGLNREEAVEFSFLLSLPTIGAALALSLLQMLKEGVTGGQAASLLAGIAASFLAGLFAVRFLLGWAKRHSFAPFVGYRVLLGAALLLIMLTR
jgi:undecaprenyl-diphosphatase